MHFFSYSLFSKIFLFALAFIFLISLTYGNEWINEEPAERAEWSRLKMETEMLLKRNPEQALSKARHARKIAELLNDRKLIRDSDMLISDVFLQMSTIDSTLYYLHKARAKNNLLQNKPKFEITNRIGNAFNILPNLDSAKYYYRLARQISLRNNDSLQSAIALNNMALVYLNTGELNLAVENFLQAARYFEENNDIDNLADIYLNLGMANQKAAKFEQSIIYFNKAAHSYLQLDDSTSLLKAYGNMAISNKRLENYDTAVYYFNKASAIAIEFNLKFDLTKIAYNQGNTYLLLGDTVAAREAFDNSMKMARESNNPMGILYNNYMLSLLEIQANQMDGTEKRLEEMQQFIEASGLKSLSSMVLERCYQLEEKRGDFAKAFDYFKTYTAFSDSLDELAREEEMEKIQLNYEMEKKDLENQRLRDLNIIQEKTIETQRLVGAFVIITLLLFSFISYIILRSKRKLATAYRKLTQLNNEINTQKQALEISNETKDKMFSVIAHDLRSPFNSLLGFLDILLNDFQGYDDDEKLEILVAIKGQGQATFELVENLLEWSMAQRGLLVSQPRPTDLYEVVDGQLANLASRAKSKLISIDLKLKPETFVFIVEKMMQTIIRNLMNNAIKFTHQGGRISIDGFYKNNQFVLSIADNGIGMTPEISEKLFGDRFPESQQGTNAEKGTGLGLMIVREFLMKMGASILVESEPGNGSTFLISLPGEATASKV